MILQVGGIGKQKIEYKDHKNIEFDSLSSYILLAKKSIAKFCRQFYSSLTVQMLSDEDAISSVANAIMMADWRWDDNYQNEKGTKKTKYSYRNQCALWAIQSYVSKNHKNYIKSKNIYSLDHVMSSEEESSNYHLSKDSKTQLPEEILIEQENKQQLSDLINNLLLLDCLTARQKDYIKLYYFESYTFEKIGHKYGITREAVRQGLNKALDIIRGAVNER